MKEKTETQAIQKTETITEALQKDSSIPKAALNASLYNDWRDVKDEDRLRYVTGICKVLNIPTPLNPFRFIDMNGKTVMYAPAQATQLIADAKGLSIEIVRIYTDKDTNIRNVEVKAISKDGRFTQDLGALYIGGLSGEKLANAYMKAITKAKRRVVLSHCGLSVADDDDLKSIDENNQRAYYTPPTTALLRSETDEETAQYKSELFKALCGKQGKFPNNPKAANEWIEETSGTKFEKLTAQEALDLLNQIQDEMIEKLDPGFPKPQEIIEENLEMFSESK